MTNNTLLYPIKDKGLWMSHLNTRSIFNKMDEIRYYLKEINHDIFSVSETWLTRTIPDSMVSINNYNLIRNDRHWVNPISGEIKKGGGVAIYIKQGLTFSDENLRRFDQSTKDYESCWVKLLLNNQKNIIVGCVYRINHLE